MTRIVAIALCMMISMTAHAKNYDYKGTRDNPRPLTSSGPQPELKSLTLYLYKDGSYEIVDSGKHLFSGTFSDNGNSVSFSNKVAFANKVYFSSGKDKMTCLQTVFYQPEKYKYKSDWFCPSK